MNKIKNERRQKQVRTTGVKAAKPFPAVDENTGDLVEKLKEISLNAEHIESFIDDLDLKQLDKKSAPAEHARKSSTLKENKRFDAPKTTAKRGKKKNSFIVSDSSTTDDDGIAVYHRVLTERIREDVKKLTPRRPVRTKTSHDDGIFTPYIIRRRSDWSDSDFSDKENINNDVKPNVKKYLLNDSIEKPKTNDSGNGCADRDVSDSGDSFKSAKSELSSISSASLDAGLKEKDLSWCFSDRETSEDNEISKEKDEKQISPSVTPLRKNSVSTTPITFRLNNLKKHTPTPQRLKTPEELQSSWLFLHSLSMCTGIQPVHPEAEQYKKKFKKLKEKLAEKLFSIFNEDVFDSKLPFDTKIEWSGRMRSSSGFCFNRRIKTIIGPNKECPRVSRIVLSTKIIETPERLRDTLIHEMCHAAAWIIDNKADGHGPYWKSWVSKVHRKFPELPPIRRCHDYKVKTKFQYRCVNCSYTIGRHSKSLNLERKRCGYCYGKFELLLHHEEGNAAMGHSPKHVKAKPLSKFALFVKDNYAKVKSENSNLKHGEIMKALSKNFAETKNLT